MMHATYPPNSGMLTVSEHSALLTETVCSSTSCSFYSPAGEVEEDALMAMLPKDQDWNSVIGESMFTFQYMFTFQRLQQGQSGFSRSMLNVT